jgi:NAD(P)-dependent dehydrogenase (short-subunit alcohol dehydrogenase family)
VSSVLVAGGGTGIGRATVQRLRGRGVDVFVADVDEVAAAASVAGSAPGRGLWAYCDLGMPDGPADAVQQAVEAFDGLDAVVCSAGVLVEQELAAISLADWERTLAVNLRAPFLLAQAAQPFLAASDAGRLVFTGSTSAFRGGVGTAAYAASKGGLAAMTRSLALGLAKDQICVNCVAPGWIDTPFNDPYWQRVGDTPAARDALESRIPLGHQGAPEQVAAVIDFLLSREAGYLTGQTIVVDGGLLAG